MGSMAPYLGKSQCDVNLTKEQLGFLDTLRIMAFYIACGYSIMLYDWIVTLDQERRRIWRARWSLGKVLFLWNRYHALAGFGILLYAFTSYWDQDVCERFYLFEGLSGFVVELVCEAILALRIFAMYERSKAMGAFLAVLIIAEGTVILTGAALYKRVPVPPGYPGCAAYYEEGPEGHLAAAGYISLMIVDFIFLALTLFKVWQFRRYTSGDLGTTMRVILRDGVLYFGVIFAVHLLNAIFVLQQANKQLQPINAPFAVMITSVLTSRLCLNLRRERDMDSLVNLDITQPPEMSMVGMGEWDGGRRGSMSEADAAAAEEGDLGNASMTSATRFGTVNMLSRTVTHALSERSIRDPFRDQSGADADGDRIDKDAGGDLCANEKASASGENSGGGSSARSSRSQDQDRRGYPNAFINHAPVQLHDQAQAREAGNEPWTHTRAGSSVKLQSKPHTGLQVEALALSGPARPALRPRSETVAKTGEGNGECFGSGRARAE